MKAELAKLNIVRAGCLHCKGWKIELNSEAQKYINQKDVNLIRKLHVAKNHPERLEEGYITIEKIKHHRKCCCWDCGGKFDRIYCDKCGNEIVACAIDGCKPEIIDN